MMTGYLFPFQPVAIFIVQNEDTTCIAEALRLIRDQMKLIPPVFIIDHSLPELHALERVFPGWSNCETDNFIPIFSVLF